MANTNKQSPSKAPEESQQLHEFTALNFNSLTEKYTTKTLQQQHGKKHTHEKY